MGLGDPARETLRREAPLRLRVAARARGLLDELRSRPELVPSECWNELQELVGPAYTWCWTDAKRFRAWTVRAAELLRAIASTPPAALSDSEWTALLGQAAEALEEAASARAAALADGDLLRRIPHVDDLAAALADANRRAFVAQARMAAEAARVTPTPGAAEQDAASRLRRPHTNPGGSVRNIGGPF